ncbi:MAG: ATP-binding cassette domain-containing protein [Acidobacteriota bacterium]
MVPAIKVEHLRKVYPGGVEAVRDLSFSVPTGCIFGLLGPNGAGKSTTVRVLVTLTLPSGGRAKVQGIDVVKHEDRVRHQIGYVSQASALDAMATAREILTLQGQMFRVPGRQLKTRVDELLEGFGLAHAADRTVGGYSGGMKRRLDLALGLVHRPRVLFLDEPTTGLDPESRATLWREVQTLARETGLTILLTTHYLEEADQLADQLAIVEHGQIIVEGTPDELKNRLEGDVLTIELGGPESDTASAAEALSRLNGFIGVQIEDRTLHARFVHGASIVAAAVSAFEDRRLEVAQVALKRPSLDDVYLSLTGRSLGEVEAA